MTIDNNFIRTHAHIVRCIARQYGKVTNQADLMQEGYIGLIEAAKRYDPNTGVKFDSYASWWVRKYILEALNQYGNMVRLPMHNPSAVERCISESLDRVVRVEDGEPLTYNDLLPDDTPNVDEKLTLQTQITALHVALNTLPPRMQTVIRSIYGIGCRKKTRTELAKELGVSYEVVKKIHQNAIKMLRRFPIFAKRS